MMMSSHTVYVHKCSGRGGGRRGLKSDLKNNSHSSDNSAKPKVRCMCFLRRNIICSYESCPKSNIQVNYISIFHSNSPGREINKNNSKILNNTKNYVNAQTVTRQREDLK